MGWPAVPQWSQRLLHTPCFCTYSKVTLRAYRTSAGFPRYRTLGRNSCPSDLWQEGDASQRSRLGQGNRATQAEDQLTPGEAREDTCTTELISSQVTEWGWGGGAVRGCSAPTQARTMLQGRGQLCTLGAGQRGGYTDKRQVKWIWAGCQ